MLTVSVASVVLDAFATNPFDGAMEKKGKKAPPPTVGAAKRQTNPKEIFHLAQALLEASNHLDSQWKGTKWLTDPYHSKIPWAEYHKVIPAMVNAAFSTELFLKCLHTIETGKAPPSHVIRVLVNGLNASTRSRLVKIYNSMISQSDAVASDVARGRSYDFDEVLKVSVDSSFVTLRYIYEQTTDGTAAPIIDRTILIGYAVRQLILEMHPEWENEYEATSRTH